MKLNQTQAMDVVRRNLVTFYDVNERRASSFPLHPNEVFSMGENMPVDVSVSDKSWFVGDRQIQCTGREEEIDGYTVPNVVSYGGLVAKYGVRKGLLDIETRNVMLMSQEVVCRLNEEKPVTLCFHANLGNIILDIGNDNPANACPLRKLRDQKTEGFLLHLSMNSFFVSNEEKIMVEVLSTDTLKDCPGVQVTRTNFPDLYLVDPIIGNMISSDFPSEQNLHLSSQFDAKFDFSSYDVRGEIDRVILSVTEDLDVLRKKSFEVALLAASTHKMVRLSEGPNWATFQRLAGAILYEVNCTQNEYEIIEEDDECAEELAVMDNYGRKIYVAFPERLVVPYPTRTPCSEDLCEGYPIKDGAVVFQCPGLKVSPKGEIPYIIEKGELQKKFMSASEGFDSFVGKGIYNAKHINIFNRKLKEPYQGSAVTRSTSDYFVKKMKRNGEFSLDDDFLRPFSHIPFGNIMALLSNIVTKAFFTIALVIACTVIMKMLLRKCKERNTNPHVHNYFKVAP